MDGISCAASVLAIASAGLQLSIKLVSFAAQIGTASERVNSIGNDVSLVAGLLQQLGEVMGEKRSNGGVSIFNQAGLDTTMHSANMCHRIFRDLQQATFKASAQLRDGKKLIGGKFKLTATEKAKWPFLQPKIDMLRQDLQEAKGTLMLMLQVTSLAFSKRMADTRPPQTMEAFDLENMVRTIIAIQQDQAKNGNAEAHASKDHALDSCERKGEAEPLKAVDRKFITRPSGLPRFAALARLNVVAGSKTGPFSSGSNLLECDPPNELFERTSSDSSGQGSSRNSTKGAETLVSSNSSDTLSANTLATPRKAPQGKDKRQIFVLRPTIQDFFNRVELTWTKQTIHLPEKVVAQQVLDENNDLLNTLEDLHAFEQSIIDQAVRECGEGAHVISAKRTKTDMSTRNIAFKELPGLQFVVQGEATTSSSSFVSEHGLESLLRRRRKLNMSSENGEGRPYQRASSHSGNNVSPHPDLAHQIPQPTDQVSNYRQPSTQEAVNEIDSNKGFDSNNEVDLFHPDFIVDYGEYQEGLEENGAPHHHVKAEKEEPEAKPLPPLTASEREARNRSREELMKTLNVIRFQANCCSRVMPVSSSRRVPWYENKPSPSSSYSFSENDEDRFEVKFNQASNETVDKELRGRTTSPPFPKFREALDQKGKLESISVDNRKQHQEMQDVEEKVEKDHDAASAEILIQTPYKAAALTDAPGPLLRGEKLLAYYEGDMVEVEHNDAHGPRTELIRGKRKSKLPFHYSMPFIRCKKSSRGPFYLNTRTYAVRMGRVLPCVQISLNTRTLRASLPFSQQEREEYWKRALIVWIKISNKEIRKY